MFNSKNIMRILLEPDIYLENVSTPITTQIIRLPIEKVIVDNFNESSFPPNKVSTDDFKNAYSWLTVNNGNASYDKFLSLKKIVKQTTFMCLMINLCFSSHDVLSDKKPVYKDIRIIPTLKSMNISHITTLISEFDEDIDLNSKNIYCINDFTDINIVFSNFVKDEKYWKNVVLSGIFCDYPILLTNVKRVLFDNITTGVCQDDMILNLMKIAYLAIIKDYLFILRDITLNEKRCLN